MYWPRPTWRWVTVPPIGAVTIATGSSCRVGALFERGDLVVALAEDAQPVAHRGERDIGAAQGVLRGRQIGLALLPILERAAIGEIQLVLRASR